MRSPLARPNLRFATKFEIIEGGGGTFSGMIDEPSQGVSSAGQPDVPRRMLTVAPHLPITAGMVIRSPEGIPFMTGSHGYSENVQGTLFKSFMLFEADKYVTWQRRKKVIDPVTQVERDNGLENLPMLWGTYMPDPRKTFDRQVHVSFTGGNFLTTRLVEVDQLVDEKRVTRVEHLLGLWYITLG